MDRRPAGGWKLSQKECGKWRSGHGMLLEDGKGKGRRESSLWHQLQRGQGLLVGRFTNQSEYT